MILFLGIFTEFLAGSVEKKNAASPGSCEFADPSELLFRKQAGG